MNKQSLEFLYSRSKNLSLTKEQTESKVCQDILIALIGSDPEIRKRVAFKGGIVIDYLSKGKRGYTKDIDFDFVKYPLSNDGIIDFFNRISKKPPYKNIAIEVETISDLRHKNYLGKRVNLLFRDNKDAFHLVVDIGVFLSLFRKNIEIEYELKLGNKTNIFINPVERIVAEKLSTFAIYGTDNTRDKDLFDAYFFLVSYTIDLQLVKKMLTTILVKKNHYYKTFKNAATAIIDTLTNKRYVKFLNDSEKNWTDVPASIVIEKIKGLLQNLISF